jgi:hypothetical protein
MSIRAIGALAGSAAILMSTAIAATGMSKDEMIKNAMSAAPKAVAESATVIDWDMNELRKGTNNFTCLPDDPTTPTNDPMCADQNGMEWLHAIMTKAPPPEGKIGFGYMLQGETAASNLDPLPRPLPTANGRRQVPTS